MRSASSNRHARRVQDRALPRDRSCHYHVGDAVFLNHKDAQSYAAEIAREIRGAGLDPGVVVAYVTTIKDLVAAQVQVIPCDRDCVS